MPTKRILIQEMHGTVAEGSRRTIIKLPAESEIVVVGPVLEHTELVEVTWNGQSVWVFAVDLEARTKIESSEMGEMPLLSKATFVGADTPAPNHPDEAEEPSNVEHKTDLTPKVRRFNASGRELF